jgi:hypothetical protein
LFADQHEIGLLRTFARHRLVGVAIERTSLALGLSRRQHAQGFDGFAAFLIHGLIHREECPTAVNVQNRGIKVSLCLYCHRGLLLEVTCQSYRASLQISLCTLKQQVFNQQEAH